MQSALAGQFRAAIRTSSLRASPHSVCGGVPFPPLCVDEVDTFILDQDGVLFHGTEAVPGALETVARLQGSGRRCFFVTNNSGRSRAAVAARLNAAGLRATADDVVTAGYAAAQHCLACLARTAYVVGEAGQVEELEQAGLTVSGGPAADDGASLTDADFAALFSSGHRPDAVVVGLDSHFTYRKLAMASAFVQMGALLIGTNPDAGDRIGSGLAPGAGALIAAVEIASGTRAVIVGKPSATLLTQLIKAHGLEPGRCVMVGDRLDTDIAFGSAGGVRTCLVLTGVATLREAEEVPLGDARRPDCVLGSLADIVW